MRALLRKLPPRLAESLFFRFYNNRQGEFADVFKEAQLRFAPEVVMRNLVVGDVISGQLALLGYYEYGLSREIQRLSRKGGLFVDVGANLGYFSCLWLAGRPENRAVMVEASPRNQKLLQGNLQANGFTERARVLPNAAGDAAGTVTFDIGPEEQTGWGGIRKDGDTASGIEVEMVRLDEQIDEPVAVMKIDVEGADTLVLRGCAGLLEKQMIRRIYFEQNTERMRALGIKEGEAQALLEGYGYQSELLPGSADEWVAWV